MPPLTAVRPAQLYHHGVDYFKGYNNFYVACTDPNKTATLYTQRTSANKLYMS